MGTIFGAGQQTEGDRPVEKAWSTPLTVKSVNENGCHKK